MLWEHNEKKGKSQETEKNKIVLKIKILISAYI